MTAAIINDNSPNNMILMGHSTWISVEPRNIVKDKYLVIGENSAPIVLDLWRLYQTVSTTSTATTQPITTTTNSFFSVTMEAFPWNYANRPELGRDVRYDPPLFFVDYFYYDYPPYWDYFQSKGTRIVVQNTSNSNIIISSSGFGPAIYADEEGHLPRFASDYDTPQEILPPKTLAIFQITKPYAPYWRMIERRIVF